MLLVEEGDTIPADGRLLRTTALQTAEAALTGESLPVNKEVAPAPADAGLGDRTDMVFMNTNTTRGTGQFVLEEEDARVVFLGDRARLLPFEVVDPPLHRHRVGRRHDRSRSSSRICGSR